MERRPGWCRLVVALVVSSVCGITMLAGCGHSPQRLAVVVTPEASRADEPIAISVTGLTEHAAAEVEITSTDAAGEVWTSEASFTADADGVVDVSTAAATGGSYLGVSAVGLITSMHTADAAARPLLTYREPRSGPSTFEVTARANGVQQTTTFTRTFVVEPLTDQTLTMTHDHIDGRYFAPANPTQKQPAILVFGGSEGGNDEVVLASEFAARGIPALAIAYFDAPGLPKHLTKIPLEYFQTALTWLRRQPGVDPDRVWVSGASYGSEAALLLGSRRPDLVHGVLSLSGGNTVTCSATAGTVDRCNQAPFTSGGTPIPFTRQYGNPTPTDVPAAIIPVEKIKGPVIALCGGADIQWDACQLSQAVLNRRQHHGTGRGDLLLSYPDAGHHLDFLLPYRPINPADDEDNGSTAQANPQAEADAWPQILTKLTTN